MGLGWGFGLGYIVKSVKWKWTESRDTDASGSDADVVILLLDLVGTVGLDVDVLADTEVDESREIEQAARITGEDLQLSDDISHCGGWIANSRGELLGF